MGHTYAGPGATIGPAITFGYLAALHAAGVEHSPAPAQSATQRGRQCPLIRRSHSAPSCPNASSAGQLRRAALPPRPRRRRAATDPRELRYAYEKDLHVLPTFAVVAPTLTETEAPRVSYPGIEIELAKVLHGTQQITAHRPLTTDGKARAVTRVAHVWDKGSAAVVVTETEIRDLSGEKLWTNRSSIFAKGEGGFGGERGPSSTSTPPDRAPDDVLTTTTLPQQALWYRLLGRPQSAAPRSRLRRGGGVPGAHPARAGHLRHRLQGPRGCAAGRRSRAGAIVRRPLRGGRLPGRDAADLAVARAEPRPGDARPSSTGTRRWR